MGTINITRSEYENLNSKMDLILHKLDKFQNGKILSEEKTSNLENQVSQSLKNYKNGNFVRVR